MLTNSQIAQRIAELELKLADLNARMPAHSIPPAMLIQVEDIEDELERLRREAEKRGI